MNSNNTIYPVIREVYKCKLEYQERVYKIDCKYTGMTDILKVLVKLKLYEDQTIYMEFRDIKVILRITKNKFTAFLDTEDESVNRDIDVNVFEEFMKQYDYPIMDIRLQQHSPSGTIGN